MIEPDRIQLLNESPIDDNGQYVLYWMQQSQRAAMNPALEHAAHLANKLDLPLITAFSLYSNYPDANERHFAFMLEGLAETSESLANRKVKMVVRLGSLPDIIADLAQQAALIVCDHGYLRHQRKWRKELAATTNKRLIQVEGDVVVPVETTSDKREWAARTIRKKVNQHRDHYIKQIPTTKLKKSSLPLRLTSDIDLQQWQPALEEMHIDHSVHPVDRFRSGTQAARKRLTRFLRKGLPGYAKARNDPSEPQASELSPYLHFGQISPVEIAIKVQRNSVASEEDKNAFLEELIVRRELACNFVYYTHDYDSFACLPEWAQKTLSEHKNDQRPTRYSRNELDKANTADPYWNAAMQEMVKTGYMHNYMRMYWGKKLLEWCNTPEDAYATALYLNNRYFLDGRDPNSYSNVAWLFGLHDQAWAERKIYGKVRYMSANGLKSKFNIDKYVRWVDTL